MTPRQFYELTKEMRYYQRRYFRHRSDIFALAKARELETAIDAEISRVEGILLRKEKEQCKNLSPVSTAVISS